MATNPNAANPSTMKKVDLPSKGNRNADPITNAPGAHPVETGVGAVLGGAGAGFVAGLVAGPVGVVIGTVAGAVAGGLAGKEVGEKIDPTTENEWLNEYYSSSAQSVPAQKRPVEAYRSAYSFGLKARRSNQSLPFEQAEGSLAEAWTKSAGPSDLKWNEVQHAVRHAYSRNIQANKKPK